MTEKRRIVWVDNAKYICIMFVMMSHLQSDTDIMRAFYAPFYLSVFFFCSGYVHKSGLQFKTYIIKKTKGLLVPWFVFSFLIILSSHVISFNQHDSILIELLRNCLQIRGYGDELWFIAALFVASIPFYYWAEKMNKWIALCSSLVLTIVSSYYEILFPKDIFPWGTNSLPWHFEYIFIPVFFMLLGYYYKMDYEESIENRLEMSHKVVIVLVYIIFSLVTYFFEIPAIIFVMWNIIHKFLGVMTIVIISKSIPYNCYIQYIGSNTLLVFALHGKCLSVIETVLRKVVYSLYVFALNNVLSSIPLCVAIALLISFILIVPIWIINNYLPFLIGRKRT